MSNLISLLDHGQSVWLDYIDRNLVDNGGLKELVALGVRGVTSNPTIFQKAITQGQDYDAAIRDLIQADHSIDANGLLHWLTLQDVQAAADILHNVYISSKGLDGYISLEVSPHLAHDTEATIAAAQALWRQVKRPNLMIKVPATVAGIPAVENLIAEGINVNVTLLFSASRYAEVAQAYLRGLQKNPDPKNVASVASFFISRIDTRIDEMLGNINTPEASELQGKIAIANAKRAYRHFLEICQSDEFRKQFERGAGKQRLLWASTAAKNPAYSELLYVEQLVGQDTVTTLPPDTLQTYIQRGEAYAVLEDELDNERANRHLDQLDKFGVDLEQICEHLEAEGIASFAQSHDHLLAVLRKKCAQVAEDYAGA